ncbi:hypothetical protein [Chengkuizengella axinellae]|uniref:Uncharacterized protein n=1 Tax=Chengkuizengella axinellae TaxID=3064388 RepID=A0ABT9IZY4_9BACL|nr:hypothetical protein [Chengkuizengella sp. 2205SS18-9]MDP5274930.1 hypothetical protein [Chengkuizengella sp. 2205SS18-9]
MKYNFQAWNDLLANHYLSCQNKTLQCRLNIQPPTNEKEIETLEEK